MPKKPRILIFGWAQSPHIQRWAEGLTSRGFEIKVVSSGGEPLPNIETVVFPYSGMSGYLRYAKQAAAEAKKFQPDVVHVHYAFGFGWWGMRAKITPIVVSLWGTDVISLSRNPLTRFFGKRLFTKAAYITTPSQYLEKQAVSFWPEIQNKVKCIPFGVAVAPEPAPFPPSPVKLAYVKWHRAIYGPDLLLQAMAILKQRGIAVQLDMAGSGELTEQLQGMIQSLNLSDTVRMVGKLDLKAIPDFLKAHHLMVMPSRMESFGVSALEAAAVGRPVIATNVGGIPEAVKHTETGLLVPSENPTALADAIQQMITSPNEMERIGSAGHAMVKTQYSWERSLDLMSEVYERVVHAAS